MNKRKIKARVEYQPITIRHLALQCPECNNWFHASDVCKDYESYIFTLCDYSFRCPICNYECEGMSLDSTIEKRKYPNVYEDCMEKENKIIWRKMEINYV